MSAAPTVEFAAELLEKYWCDDFLFDPVNAHFREKVSPLDASDPPSLACTAFLRYASAPDTADGVAALREAAAKSSLVVVSLSGGTWTIRRRALLDPKNDPALRTVVLWPVPRNATAEQISDFAEAKGSGPVEVALPLPCSNPSAQHKIFTLRLSSEAAACNFAAAELSYGRAESELAQLFLPKELRVSLYAEFMARQQERKAEQEKKQLEANITHAQKALAEVHSGEHTVTRFLRNGVTLIAEGIAPGTTWQALKAKLGGFALKDPALKHGIVLVRVEESASRAFIVCRDGKTAKELRSIFALADDAFSTDLRAMCPVLRVPTEAEEKYAHQNFPEWCERRVEAKRADNRKRQHR